MSSIGSRLRRHLADTESHHRKIAVGFVRVSLFVFIGKLAGAAKEMAIAWRYGVSETVDAYVFVFNLVVWPVSVWFSVLTVVLVPLVAHLQHDNPDELPRFRGELLGLTLIIGSGLGILGWFGLPVLLRAGWFGLSDQALAKALHMAGGLVLLVPMGALISLFSAWMLACGCHRNTLFESIPALAILTALLLPPGWVPEPLLWGTVAGFALHMAALAAPLRQRGELQALAFGFGSPTWRGFSGSVGIMAAGQVLMSFTTIIDQFFAAGFGPGALSTLSYANRILALILGMSAMTIGRATLPVFSEANKRRGADINVLALRWAKWMLIIGLIALPLLWVVSPALVELIFERGSFRSEDTNIVAIVLRYSLIQLPFYASAIVLHSLLSSRREYRTILVVLAGCFVSKWFFNMFLSKTMGLIGLPLATALMYVMLFACYFLFVSIKNNGVKNGTI